MMYSVEKLETIALLGELMSRKDVSLDESLIVEVGMFLTGEMDELGINVEETIMDLMVLPNK